MPYTVEAWMEEGVPRVRLRDPASGSVQLDWTVGGADAGAGLQQLMKDLIRIACVERLALSSRGQNRHLGEECMHCWGCAPGDVTAVAPEDAGAARRAR